MVASRCSQSGEGPVRGVSEARGRSRSLREAMVASATALLRRSSPWKRAAGRCACRGTRKSATSARFGSGG